MTSERTDQSATPGNHHSHPGATLAAQREAMGWSVEQVAEQLKLTVRQVVAIEAADYASLPGPAVTRGFVRAYAKILRLDPAPLVAMIPMDNPVVSDDGAALRRDRASSRPTSFSHSRYPTHGKRSSLPLGWIAGVIVLAAAAGAAWHFGLVSLPGSASTPAGNEAGMGTPAENGTVAAPAAVPEHDTSVPLISVPAPADGAAAGAGTPAAPAAGTGAAPAATPGATGTVTTTTPATATPAATAQAATAPAATAPAAPAAAPTGANTRC
ncbi:helix-turn-helix domain-containing protein [Massilia sp. Dwa41.01b]|uniref:helix-turn-helix domain-containing protein n=1 Tax=Massilia sp. Dwa41.01b TaxID=2709302 RepID=UPI001E42F189|nr:helix-turn-helix domain-containing protein [Massilia sp. Dwa41.01b]